MGMGTQRWAYALEQLHDDQDPAIATDAIAPLICWLEPEARGGSHRFELFVVTAQGTAVHELTLSWQLELLAGRDPRLAADLRRFRHGKTEAPRDAPGAAAYGLALVAISCLLHRRIAAIHCFEPPDIVLESTERGTVRGVSVGASNDNGRAALEAIADGAGAEPGKRPHLRASPSIAEAYLSLWCREPPVAVWERVKP